MYDFEKTEAAEAAMAEAAGYRDVVHDPAWQEASRIDDNEAATFRGPNADAGELEDSYPRPIGDVLAAYDFGDWNEGYRERLRFYLISAGTAREEV